MLVRAVARPRHRACGGATARDARSWCCRAAHAALRVSSIVVGADDAFRLGRAQQLGEAGAAPADFGRQSCPKGAAGYVRVLSSPQAFVCVLQPGHASAVVKLVRRHARFRRRLAVREHQLVFLLIFAWRSGRATAQHSHVTPADTPCINCSTPHTERYCSSTLHARRHIWYRRRRIERHRCGALRAARRAAHERT